MKTWHQIDNRSLLLRKGKRRKKRPAYGPVWLTSPHRQPQLLLLTPTFTWSAWEECGHSADVHNNRQYRQFSDRLAVVVLTGVQKKNAVDSETKTANKCSWSDDTSKRKLGFAEVCCMFWHFLKVDKEQEEFWVTATFCVISFMIQTL